MSKKRTIDNIIKTVFQVDFFWINRDQKSFEWFVNLLSQLEIEQAELGGAMERFLEMHMYITSALQKTDMKAVGLQLALDLLHEKVCIFKCLKKCNMYFQNIPITKTKKIKKF